MILKFVEKDGPGEKFCASRDKLLKILTLPKTIHESLKLPADIAQKIKNGEPLWDEEKEEDHDAENDDEDEDDSQTK